MLIKELSSCLAAAHLYGDGDIEISDLQADSRKVGPGDLFICLPGHTVDGHDYAPQAATKGAAALVCERKLDIDLPQIVVDDCRYAMSVLSNAFFGSPSSRMKLIGITGTNGKTTTTYLIERIMQDHGVKTGLIGTIQMRYDGQSYPMSGTTQESLELQRSLNHMALKGVQCCVMEVSSHALQQGRVKGTDYRTAIFTNLTQDHLDYHHTMEEYRAVKGLFFSRLGNVISPWKEERKYAVLNADDEASAYFATQTAAEVITYGIDKAANVRASQISITAKGTFSTWRRLRVRRIFRFAWSASSTSIMRLRLLRLRCWRMCRLRTSRPVWSRLPAWTAVSNRWMPGRISR